MVKIRKPKKDNKEIISIENPEIIGESISKTEEFLNKNKNLIYILSGSLILLFILFSTYNFIKDNQNIEAQEEMFQAVYYFEQDSLVKALNGDGNNYGFLEIIDEYSLSDAANLSHYYAGVSYLKLGNYNNAISYLLPYSSSDLLLQARAYSLIGDAYVELQNYNNAIKYFKLASSNNPNEYFTPKYILKLALVYEKIDDLNSAINSYDQIIDEFKDSPEFQISLKNKSRLEGLI
ncbi:MAG: cytochrome C biosynthesis protein [Flammeovirgaceae bacterium]|nr:cytochrome C biosynthesis protein [Flammeovirgaceae bacterium]